MKRAPLFPMCLAPALVLMAHGGTFAQEPTDSEELRTSDVVQDVLTPTQWDQLDESVDDALEFLATQQLEDGSFDSEVRAQPAVTSFCIMAYLSRGHLPEQGPYGERLSRAIDYVLSTQQGDGLLFAHQARDEDWKLFGNYNHPIAGIMLGEVYGMGETRQSADIRRAIEAALIFTRQHQLQPRSQREKGGWRYLIRSGGAPQSDLSVTAWHLMFYRSARNAQFEVSKEQIDEALAYVRRCYVPQRGSFCYATDGRDSFSRSMAGAGILSLALAGEHQSDMAKETGRFVLRHPFDRFNRGNLTAEDRFYYGAYYCSQAMFQLGGDYWKQFYPILLETLADNQRRNGSWELEANQDQSLGYAYSTSLAVLALTPPYQLLPIYQR